MTTKIDLTNIADTALTTLTGPKVTTIVYPGDDTATDTAGGQTINLTGNGFQSGCSVLVGSTAASVVTFISTTQISFTAPVQTAGTYVIYVINPDGGTAISIPGISYSGTPTWTTSAGTLGNVYETASISNTVTATGDAPITYSLVTGTLPTGSTLNSNGTLSGTAVATASITTYSFTIKATDAQNQDTNRAFSLTINPDVVTWSSPANLTTYNVFTNSAIANVTMSATSAAGGSITYTADTLPTGLSITGANIAGTPTVAASTTTTLTATATSTRTATRTINWVVTVSNDTYFKNTTLLLNGETTVTPFISDASSNSFGLTINDDTKPVLFNPYTPGYYSTDFIGGANYLTVPTTAQSALNFATGCSIEGWYYNRAIGNYGFIFDTYQGTGGFVGWWFVGLDPSGYWRLGPGDGTADVTSTIMTLNTWHHWVLTNDGTRTRLFVNGVLIYTKAVTPQNVDQYFVVSTYGGGYYGSYPVNGCMSNMRFIKGSANVPASYVTASTTLGTTIFTPPTTPLTAVTGTGLLLFSSNRLIDDSGNNFAMTVVGSPIISPNIPFTANASYSTYGSTYFDGTGDYLRYAVNTNSAFNFGTGDFTLEAWIYPTITSGNYNIINQSQNNSEAGWTVALWISAGAARLWHASGSSYPLQLSGGTITANSWYHIAGTRSGNTWKLWVNGIEVATGTSSTTITQDSSHANAGGINIGVGFIAQATTASALFFGYISNARVVKGTAVYTTTFTPPTTPLTAITNTQLLTLQYNGGANNSGFIDNSNFNNIITRNGNTSQGTFSPYSVTGWSNYFDGTGDYLSPSSNTPMDFGTGNFTIEGWFLTGDKSISVGANRMIIGNSGNSYTMQLYIDSSGFLTFGNTGSTFIRGSTDLANNIWNHFAIVRSGTGSGQIKMYVNGIEVASGTNSITYASGTIFIGAFGASDGFWNGYISNLRIIKGTAVYTANFTPSTTPLTAIANTSLLTCQSNRFIDNSPNNFTLTPTGDVSVQAYSPFGSIPEAVPISYSNYFNGSSYLSVASNANLNLSNSSFTIELWIFGTGGYPQGIISKGTTSSLASEAWSIEYTNSSGGIAFGSGAYNGWNASMLSGTINLNAWNHVAVVRNVNAHTMYINGVSVSTLSASYTVTDAGTLYVGTGWYAPGSRIFSAGYISSVRLVIGTAVYTGNFTPSTAPLTAIANTQLLTCQSTRMIDNSTNAFTITAVGDTKPKQYNPFGYTAQSITSYTPSLHGGSAYFDGTGDYLTTPNSSTVANFSNLPFTVEFWMYSTDADTVFIRQNAAGTPNWAILIVSGSIYWQNGYEASSLYYIALGTLTTNPLINAWTHIAITRNDVNQLKFWINGVGQSSVVTDSTDYNSTNGIVVGSGSYGAYTKYLSDVRITKGVAVYTSNFVPPTQTLGNYSTSYPASLLLNFNNGGIIDQHGTNVLETVGNAQLSTAVKKYNVASLSFNGSSQYLSIPNNPNWALGTGDFTIEFWVYFNAFPSATWMVQLSQYVDTNNRVSIFFGNNATNENGLVFKVVTSSTVYKAVENDSASITMASLGYSTLTWYHVAITRSGSTIKGFINGTQKCTTTTSATFPTLAAPLLIGSFDTTPQFTHNGYIDDLRITKGFARYTGNFTAPTSALITK